MNTGIDTSLRDSDIFHEMPDSVFVKLSRIIYDEAGIKLGEHKKLMLASRLNKRLKALGIRKYSDYYDFISNSGDNRDELQRMIDVVSTNKTDFFREDAHFDFLVKETFPALKKLRRHGEDGEINIWSAGCSSGEEPYTIALLCAEYCGGCKGRFRVFATDISNRVLEMARQAVYPDSALECVPAALKKKYFMMGKGNKTGYHKIVPELRERVIIKRQNLINDDFKSMPKMDIIFCRNVVIYFDRETQVKLHKKLLDQIYPGGYFFIGHSETLLNANENVERIAPTIYRKYK